MNEARLKKYHALLLAKRKQLLEEMGLMEGTFADTLKGSTGDLSSHSYHMADLGTDAMDREMTFMLASKSGRLLYHIDEALRRIKDGSYGKCHICGKMIKAGRLEAVPHARFCIACKSAEERKRSGR